MKDGYYFQFWFNEIEQAETWKLWSPTASEEPMRRRYASSALVHVTLEISRYR